VCARRKKATKTEQAASPPVKKVATRKPRPTNPRVPSTSAKATYMREYRARKAAGDNFSGYRRTTPDDLRRMVELRSQGWTYRAIAEELSMDHSYVARLTKREMAEGRGLEPQG